MICGIFLNVWKVKKGKLSVVQTLAIFLYTNLQISPSFMPWGIVLSYTEPNVSFLQGCEYLFTRGTSVPGGICHRSYKGWQAYLDICVLVHQIRSRNEVGMNTSPLSSLFCFFLPPPFLPSFSLFPPSPRPSSSLLPPSLPPFLPPSLPPPPFLPLSYLPPLSLFPPCLPPPSPLTSPSSLLRPPSFVLPPSSSLLLSLLLLSSSLPYLSQLGSTAVGIRTSEGVVLAVEKRITSPLMEPSSIEKILEIDSHIGEHSMPERLAFSSSYAARSLKLQYQPDNWYVMTPMKDFRYTSLHILLSPSLTPPLPLSLPPSVPPSSLPPFLLLSLLPSFLSLSVLPSHFLPSSQPVL